MDFNITTPALLFSAISLWMLAFTNRFLAVANLVRQFVALYSETRDEGVYRQLMNFRLRLSLIKYTQLFGVLSFLLCVACMFLIFARLVLPAEILFGSSLLALMASLVLSLAEVFLSIDALKLELEKSGRIHAETRE